MIDFKKRYIKTIRLNSFKPLCWSEIGKNAIAKYGLPPFVDNSCRREPDFESDYPPITTICRQELFAPNLCPNDIVIYITTQGKWFNDYNHHRLVAILEVIEQRKNHESGFSFYTSNGYKLPSNCLVEENPPLEFDRTAGDYQTIKDIKKYLGRDLDKQDLIGKQRIKLWDNRYKERVKRNSVFNITKPIYINVHNPPVITDKSFKDIFGRIPNTRNPNKIQKTEFKELALLAGVNVILD